MVFIILGVGADDIFVLVDSWKQTADDVPADAVERLAAPDCDDAFKHLVMHRRLCTCYEHTMATVLNTSFTTATAFVATAFSPLMPIATFGVYAAITIVVNYLFVITLMPPVVVVAELYFSKNCWESSTRTKSIEGNKSGDVELVVKNAAADEAAAYHPVASAGPSVEPSVVDSQSIVVKSDEREEDLGGEQTHVDADTKTTGYTAVQTSEEKKKDVGFTEYFIEQYISFMEASVSINLNADAKDEWKIPVVSLVLAFGLLAFGLVGIVYGARLEPPTEQEEWFPSQHMFTKANKDLTNAYLSADDAAYEPVSLTFGIAGINRKGFDEYKPGYNRGVAVFDDNWDLSHPACQKAIVKMCDGLPTQACSSDACEPTELLVRASSTECFMTDFRTWANATYGEDTYLLNQIDFMTRLDEYRTTETQVLNPDRNWQELIGFVGGNLKFVTVEFLSTMESQIAMSDKFAVEDAIMDMLNTVKAYDECTTGGCDCSSLMFSSPYAFSWMRSEKGLLVGFYQGMFIAFPVAFMVLLVATGNVLIAIFAILSVGFIAWGVLGFANYGLHWNLGVAESIAGIIIIGFSVDYTVHLGHMFTNAEKEGGYTTREKKFEFTSRKIVATIVGGAITTVGAGVFLFACQLTFFFKMAALIVSTIFLSYVYSLGFFMAVLYLFGPEGNFGNVVHHCAPVINFVNEQSGKSAADGVSAPVIPAKAVSMEEGEAAVVAPAVEAEAL